VKKDAEVECGNVSGSYQRREARENGHTTVMPMLQFLLFISLDALYLRQWAFDVGLLASER
jgi:hypothetical protein